MRNLTPRKLAEGIQLCIANAERFINSAERLAQHDKRSAFLLYLYAIEEMGKVIQVANVMFYLTSDEKMREWRKRFRDHGEKFWFSKDLDDIAQGRMVSGSNAKDKQLAQRKQKITFVDLDENDFIAPEEVSEVELRSIKDLCKSRLAFLHQNHSSVDSDEESIKWGLENLSGKSEDELKQMLQKELLNSGPGYGNIE